ncbi:hypothetical protein GCM10027262_62050 [Nocardia tengchongensis]
MLVSAVLNYLGTESAAQDFDHPLSAWDPRWQRHWIVLVRCIFDGFNVGVLQEKFQRGQVTHPCRTCSTFFVFVGISGDCG